MSQEINSTELTKAQEDEFAMELAKADFLRRISEVNDSISPSILAAIGQAFQMGFKMGTGWRDMP